MYQRDLHITIFSQDDAIEAALRNVMPCEHFTHAFSLYAAPQDEALAKADIVIFEAAHVAELTAMRAKAPAKALFCLRLTGGSAADLPASLWDEAHDVWFCADAAGVAFYFAKLLRGLKEQADLRLTRHWLDTAIDASPNLIWFKDTRGAHLKVNEEFCRAVDKTKAEIEGRGHYFIWDLKREEYEKGEFVCLETDVLVLESGQAGQYDEVVKCRNEMRRFMTYKSPLFDEDGSVMGTVGIAHDVTKLQNISAELEVILQSIPFALLITDASGCIVNANEKYLTALKIAKEDLVGQEYEKWRAAQNLTVLPGTTEGITEMVLHRPEGDAILDVYERDILDTFSNAIGRLHIYKNVTVERALKRRLSHYANTDALTSLYNRRYFYAYALSGSMTGVLGLLYIDLDNFKPVNDRYGHEAGDRALLLLADLLRQHMPSAVIARLGGDEFVILYSNCTIEVLQRAAQDLLESMHSAFEAHEELRGLSASIGIAMAESGAVTPDELIRRGDVAMYEAKRLGKARWAIYIPDLEKTRPQDAVCLSGTWRRNQR